MEMVEKEQNQHRQVSSKLDETLAGEEDRISALPDCLIIHILSLLPETKYAIRTGTLSKRWNPLWTWIPTLIFKENEIMPDFLLVVNKTLTQCRQVNLNRFEICTVYDSLIESQLQNSIDYATSCNVEKLSLAIRPWDIPIDVPLRDRFFINSGFTDLKLEGFVFCPNGAINWKMLRSLCVTYGNLDEELIENILSGSPVLETLELCDCYGYKRLDITSKSVKNLVFHGYNRPTDVIEINAPGVLSLRILRNLSLRKLLLVGLPSLVEAELDYVKCGYYEETRKEAEEEMLKGLIQSLHHVKELKVRSRCYKVLSRLEAKGFSFPSNMMAVDDYPQSYSDSDSFDEDDFFLW